MRNGELPNRYYALWRSACEEAGLTGVRVYDLRRSAIRNLTRAGVPEKFSMGISGHKTREMFRRAGSSDPGQASEIRGSLAPQVGFEPRGTPPLPPR